MAKPLYATPEMIEEACAEIDKQAAEAKKKLSEGLIKDGTIEYKQAYHYPEGEFERPVIEISPRAWMKMAGLVAVTSSEIAWYSTVERIDDLHFKIEDVFVPPQSVSGTFVDIDEAKRAEWYPKTFDFDTSCKVRFHGHSHVNMGTGPSSTDMNHRKKVLDDVAVSKEAYYIFLIMNKSYEYTIALYDMKTNGAYDTKDIDLIVGSPEDNIIAWAKGESKEKLSPLYASNKQVKSKSKSSKDNITPIGSKTETAPALPANNEKDKKPTVEITRPQLQISSTAIKNNCMVPWAEAEAIADMLVEEVNDGIIRNRYNELLEEASMLVDSMVASGYGSGYYGGYAY